MGGRLQFWGVTTVWGILPTRYSCSPTAHKMDTSSPVHARARRADRVARVCSVLVPVLATVPSVPTLGFVVKFFFHGLPVIVLDAPVRTCVSSLCPVC